MADRVIVAGSLRRPAHLRFHGPSYHSFRFSYSHKPCFFLFIFRLTYGPYIHHCAGTPGHFKDVMIEACKYIPGLRPDPAV